MSSQNKLLSKCRYSRDHYVRSYYMVLASFSSSNTRTGGWRRSGIANKGTYKEIVTLLLKLEFLEKKSGNTLVVTGFGRLLCKLLQLLLFESINRTETNGEVRPAGNKSQHEGLPKPEKRGLV